MTDIKIGRYEIRDELGEGGMGTVYLAYDPTSTVRVMAMHLTAPIPNLLQAKPDLPPLLEAVLQKTMAKEPADRYTTAQEMVTAIKAATAPAPTVTVHETVALTEPPTTKIKKEAVPQEEAIVTTPIVAGSGRIVAASRSL